MRSWRAVQVKSCGPVMGWLVILIWVWGLPLQAASWEEVAEESFWFSFYNLESLVLTSGLGWQYPGNAREPLDPILTDPQLKGFVLLQAPFRSGNPRYSQVPQLDDPATLHWDSIDMERTISLEALAYTVIAELEWAKRLRQFARAQSDSTRFAHHQAELFNHLALAALGFAEQKLKRSDGLYRDELRWWRDTPLVEGPPPWRGQLAWFWALSVHASADPSDLALHRVKEYYTALESQIPWNELDVQESALAVKALSWFAMAMQEHVILEDYLHQVSQLCERLLQYPGEGSIADRSARISGLLYGYHLTGDARYLSGALASWQKLLALWNDQIGAFVLDPQPPLEMTIDDVGELLSAFRTVIHIAKDEGAKLMYAKFFQSLKVSGLQRAEGSEAGGGFDGDPVPDPRQAGEAPVLVGAVRFDPQSGWRVSEGRFYTTPALYAALNLLWLSVFQGQEFQGPPALGLPGDATLREMYLPHRVEVLSETVVQIQSELDHLTKDMASLREQSEEAHKLAGASQERSTRLEKELASLQRNVERQLQVMNERLQTLSVGQQDAKMLDARLEELRSQLEKQINTQLDPLTQSLERFSQQLTNLDGLSTNLRQRTGEIQNLMSRVSALEQGIPQPWLIRPEILLLAILLVGIALATVGVLRLRRKT